MRPPHITPLLNIPTTSHQSSYIRRGSGRNNQHAYMLRVSIAPRPERKSMAVQIPLKTANYQEAIARRDVILDFLLRAELIAPKSKRRARKAICH